MVNVREEQREIEEYLSQRSFYEHLDVELKDTLEAVKEANILKLISEAVEINNIGLLEDILKEILLILGNPNNGLQRRNGTRSFTVSHLVSLFSAIEHLQGDSVEKMYYFAMNLIENLDGLLFEVEEFISQIHKSEDNIYIIVEWELGNDLLQYQNLVRYPFPMICKPRKWKEFKSGGYLLSNDKPTLKRGEEEQPQSVLNTLNRLQEQPFKLINVDVEQQEEYIINKLKLKGKEGGELYSSLSNQTMTLNQTYEAVKGREFYLTWKYDFRGRLYSQGYDINLQSDKFKKNMLKPIFKYVAEREICSKYEAMTIPQLKEIEGAVQKGRKQEILNSITEYAEARKRLGYLTERGLYWLKVNVANSLGYDKLTFDKRIEKAETVLRNLDRYKDFEERADEPLLFRNCINDYKQYLNNEPIESFMYLDASNQAFQLYAVLTSDKKTAELCNLANGNGFADAYRIVADTMNKESNLKCFNRNNCKHAVMTTLYSKGNVGGEIIKDSILLDKNPLEYDENELDELFQHSFSIVAPEAKEAMEEMLKLNNETIGTYFWTMPDNFKVKYDVKSKHEVHILGESKNGAEMVFNQEVKKYAPSEHNRGMSPNIIHSFDGMIVRMLSERINHFFTSIHDAFGVHYNFCDELRSNYLDIMVEFNNNDYLRDIMSQINGNDFKSLKKGTLSDEDILSSVYYLG